MMESCEDVSDQDLILFIKSVLESRPFPINYKSLRDLLEEGPPLLKKYVDAKYTEDKFLNFLLSNSNLFSVSPDGSVILLDSVQYVFPQSLDAVDSFPASDDSYFGDQEEYISDSEEESNASMDSNHQLLTNEILPNVLLHKAGDSKKSSAPALPVYDYSRATVQMQKESTSSSGSTPLYLSSDSNSQDITTPTSDSDSQSSFESCNCINNGFGYSDEDTSTSSSYSSCSES